MDPPATNPAADDTGAHGSDDHDMTSTDYILDLALIGLVILQIRGRRQTLISLLIPVAIVAWAVTTYLKGVPTAGNDLVLEGVCLAVGAILGVACALTTRVWRADDGYVWSKAGVAAAILWVVGVGTRLAFQEYVTHGGQAAVGRFSAAHDITSSEAWVAAILFMAIAEVVARLAVLRVRGLLVSRPGVRSPAAA